jgi:hypothetical protein
MGCGEHIFVCVLCGICLPVSSVLVYVLVVAAIISSLAPIFIVGVKRWMLLCICYVFVCLGCLWL